MKERSRQPESAPTRRRPFRIIRENWQDVFTLLFVALGAWKLGADIIAPRLPEREQQIGNYEERGIDGLGAYYSELPRDKSFDELLINEYGLGRIAFSGFAKYELKTNYSEDTLDFIQDGRRGILVDGANLVNEITDSIEFTIDEGGDRIEFQGVRFDLGNTYQEFLLDTIISRSIIANHPFESEVRKFEASREIQDLLWLAGQDLPIVVNKDSLGLPPEGIFINVARFYQEIIHLGYPVPSEILFTLYPGHGPGGGYFSETDDFYVTDNSQFDTVIHEWAHNQADENEFFSQIKYDRIVRNALEQNGVDLNNGNIYINPGILEDPDTNTEEKIIIEDYAETLSNYFVNGVGIRRHLNLLYLTDTPAYEVFKAKLEFFKEFFGDKEYVLDGDVYSPELGDVFNISDPDPDFEGVPLRSKPGFGGDDSDPRVYEYDSVEIIGGPILVNHPAGFKVNMWEVRSNRHEKEEGWMWETWLGERIIPAEVAEELDKDSGT